MKQYGRFANCSKPNTKADTGNLPMDSNINGRLRAETGVNGRLLLNLWCKQLTIKLTMHFFRLTHFPGSASEFADNTVRSFQFIRI